MTIRHDAAKPIQNHSQAHLLQGIASNRPLRVALVHDWLTGLRGGEKCLERLCLLFPNAVVHTLIHTTGKVGPIIGSMEIRTSPLQRLPRVQAYYRHLLPIMPWAVTRLDVGDVDLVISLSHCVAKAVRVPAGVPHVCYCFTPMRYAWDGRSAYLEKWRKGSLKRRLIEGLLDRLAKWDQRTASQATQFVAISRTIQSRIMAHYHRESVIIPPPVDTDYYTADATIHREDYYLAASALVPYKKIDQAVEACNRLGKKLVVIGAGPELDLIRKLAGPTVTVLGYQSDEVLRDHLRRCQALIFPGDEDFGIVPIEALACGTPVIALNRGGVAETVDTSVGLLYSDQTVESLAEAILSWESQPKQDDLALAARSRSEQFAESQFDNGVLSLIERLFPGFEGTARSSQSSVATEA